MYVFGDEAGNLDFSRQQDASQYFIIGTVALRDLSLTERLLSLRRELALSGIALETCFHASEDLQAVRDEVFDLLAPEDFRVDITILEKCKTLPRLQADSERFYKLAWFLHFKGIAPSIISGQSEMLVVAASRGTKAMRSAIRLGIDDVVRQSVSHRCRWEVAFWAAESDPGLQIADYCTWAVQRKFERADDRSYIMIADKIKTEFRPFDVGKKVFY